MQWRYIAAAGAALAFRLILICFAGDLRLGSRPEVATPITSLRRLAEGYWLKQSFMSPYSGSMYHGSPLLLPILGPLAVKRIEGQPTHLFCSLLFVIVDFVTALLIRAIGQKLQSTCYQSLQLLNISKPVEISSLAPLAAFGWVFAAHFSLYPIILIVPVILLLGYGPDAPPPKLFLKEPDAKNSSSDYKGDEHSDEPSQSGILMRHFFWRPVTHFILWSTIWTIYVCLLGGISLRNFGGLSEMFRKTHGFVLTVEDLSPNIGILWYFFAEVFVFFRDFFLVVFHMNILFMVLPLAISLKHRPCFLAFVYIAISSMLKSYPSVGDSALYLGLMGLFVNELAEMQFSFFLFCGYIGVSLLSPVMHNLWIWRGTGNANFYFATGIAYACLQTVLVVESVSTMLKQDRMLRKRLTT